MTPASLLSNLKSLLASANPGLATQEDIQRLRRKIDEGYATQLIHTVRGAGYRFGE